MSKIFLTDGSSVLVSDCDYAYLSQWTWIPVHGYAMRAIDGRYLENIVAERIAEECKSSEH